MKNEKHKNLSISFFIPAYNCEKTIEESINSIMDTNFFPGDELVIVNDASTDSTEKILKKIVEIYPDIKIINHFVNKGGACARNTCIEHSGNKILFCLDSDNILEKNSIQKLKEFMIKNSADVASFQELHYFNEKKEDITHKWIFKIGEIKISDQLSNHKVPSSSGNYMFTRRSWELAGGYPEFANALDAWGFGLRQLANGMKMVVMPNSFYYHRYGHESYWVRESKKNKISLTAIQLLVPFFDLLNENDIKYITSKKFRYTWFENLEKHPIRVYKKKNNFMLNFFLRLYNFKNLIKKNVL